MKKILAIMLIVSVVGCTTKKPNQEENVKVTPQSTDSEEVVFETQPKAPNEYEQPEYYVPLNDGVDAGIYDGNTYINETIGIEIDMTEHIGVTRNYFLENSHPYIPDGVDPNEYDESDYYTWIFLKYEYVFQSGPIRYMYIYTENSSGFSKEEILDQLKLDFENNIAIAELETGKDVSIEIAGKTYYGFYYSKPAIDMYGISVYCILDDYTIVRISFEFSNEEEKERIFDFINSIEEYKKR